jgi:hypothetical protein
VQEDIHAWLADHKAVIVDTALSTNVLSFPGDRYVFVTTVSLTVKSGTAGAS